MRWILCIDQYLAVSEKTLLVLAVLTMILMAVTQIILRNFFGFGIVWAESFIRVLVLWSALIGAMLATRSASGHIKIDIVLHLVSERLKYLLTRVLDLFAAIISFLMAYYCYQFVLTEMDFPTEAFAQVPNWVCALILPLAFFIIGLRYLVAVFVGDSLKVEAQ